MRKLADNTGERGSLMGAKCFPLFALAEKMGVRASYLGLSVQDDGEESAQKTGRIGRRTIDILVNPGIANVVLHVVFLH
jgi:hypothetical protein